MGASNRLDRQFTLAEPNKVWAGDINYIHSDEGRLFLAVVIELSSCQVVGLVAAGGHNTSNRHRRAANGLVQVASKPGGRTELPQRQRQSVSQSGLQGCAGGIRLHGLDEPTRQLLGQRCSESPFGSLKVERRTVNASRRGAGPRTKSSRLAALEQPDPISLYAGLRQPSAVRARLACGPGYASQFVTRLWGTDSRGKVSLLVIWGTRLPPDSWKNGPRARFLFLSGPARKPARHS